MKNQDGGEIWHIRLGFETASWQHAAHTRFMQSLSRERQNRASRRKGLLAGCNFVSSGSKKSFTDVLYSTLSLKTRSCIQILMYFIETRQVGLVQELVNYVNATKKGRTSNTIRSNTFKITFGCFKQTSENTS